MPPDVTGALKDILEAAGFIETDTAGMTFDAFMADRRARQLVERNFVIIGEAANRIRRHTPEVVTRIGSINQIVAFRNQLSHGYDRIDYPTVWRAVQEALPVLRAEVEMLLRESENR